MRHAHSLFCHQISAKGPLPPKTEAVFKLGSPCGSDPPTRARTPQQGLQFGATRLPPPLLPRSSGRRTRSRRCLHAAAPRGAGRITALCTSSRRTGKLSPVWGFLTLKRRGEERRGCVSKREGAKERQTPPLNSRSTASERLHQLPRAGSGDTRRGGSAAAASAAWEAAGRPLTPRLVAAPERARGTGGTLRR